MDWSPLFRDVFSEFQPTFAKICELYPEIDGVFKRFPRLMENENAIWPIIYLHRVKLIDENERNPLVANKISQILTLGAVDQGILISIRNVMISLRQFQQFNTSNVAAFFQAIEPTKARTFYGLMSELDACDVLRSTTFINVYRMLLSYVDELRLFHFYLRGSHLDALPASQRARYWQIILSGLEKAPEITKKFLNAVDVLDDMSGLTKDRFDLFLKGVESHMTDEKKLKQSLRAYVSWVEENINTFEFATGDREINSLLSRQLNYLRSVGALGVPIDDIVCQLQTLPLMAAKNCIQKIDQTFCVILTGLMRLGGMPADAAVHLIEPDCLKALHDIYQEMVFQNVSKTKDFYQALSNKLKEVSSFEYGQVLKDFSMAMRDFSWLSVDDGTRNILKENRAQVLQVCQTGLSIEEFMRMKQYHATILENMNHFSMYVLGYINQRVSSLCFYLIMLNSLSVINEMARFLASVNSLPGSSSELLDNMIEELEVVLENSAPTPQLISSFLNDYFQRLKSYNISLIHPDVRRLLQDGRGLPSHLFDKKLFSLVDLLSLDVGLQKELLSLNPEVAKLAIYLCMHSAQSLEEMDHGYVSVLSIMMDPKVEINLRELALQMLDVDEDRILDDDFHRIALVFNECMQERAFTKEHVRLALQKCRAHLCEEQSHRLLNDSASPVIQAGLFRAASNDDQLVGEDGAAKRSMSSISSMTSLESN